MDASDDRVRIGRRGVLAGLGALAATWATTWGATPAEAASKDRVLSFRSVHTGESIKAIYFSDGRYNSEALAEINLIMRDWRTGDVHPIDPKLLDVLYRVRSLLDSRKPFEIVSGYRSPRTNAMLAANSTGVAKRSLHLKGRAVDLDLPGRSLSQLRRAATSLRLGGVGYYPKSGFVHLDTGRFRTWS
ncbi:MAG: DUF882 domain-containing protein [Alphaproteobacteria bacterium]|nr:DUF882 domain-containing protein [Alphaproteobacteria bacterium]